MRKNPKPLPKGSLFFREFIEEPGSGTGSVSSTQVLWLEKHVKN
jgi:hypothetical protein